MKRKIIAMGLLIVMMFAFVGCADKDLVEVEVDDMIELNAWYFTSGVRNNNIVLEHSDSNAVFEITVDKGSICANGYFNNKAIVKAGETVNWLEYDKNSDKPIEQAYFEIILKVDNGVIGYAVVCAYKDNGSFKAKTLKSVLFKENDEYHPKAVSEKYVKKQIKRIKNRGEK